MAYSEYDTRSALTAITDESQEYLPADTHVTSMVEFSPGMHKFIDIWGFSQYKKLLRVTAYVMRFVNNCQAKKPKST